VAKSSRRRHAAAEEALPSIRSAAGKSAQPATLDRRLILIGVVVVLGTTMSSLNAASVNVAIATLGRDFNASISTVQWLLTGYQLAFASVIPIGGWACERFGTRRVWIGGLLLFITASVLSGAAWSMSALVVFRILQGMAAGVILPVGQAILAQTAGPHRMGRVLSFIGAPLLLGAVAAPVAGGLILSTIGWRWIFFINLPLGLAAVLTARRLLPRSRPQPGNRLDFRGLVLLSSGVTIFIYGLAQAGAAGGFQSAQTLVGLVAGPVLIALYVVHAYFRGDRALIDISLFRQRNFTAAVLTNLMLAIAMFGALVLLPLYWQLVRGESPFAAGLLLTPQAVGAILAMPLAGYLTDKAGAGFVVPVGILLAVLGTAAYTQVGAHTPYAVPVVALFVIGLGLGATNTPSMAAAYAKLPRDAIPRATSALHTIKRLGASIGGATIAIVLQRAITADIPQLSDSPLSPLPSATRAQLAPLLGNAFGQAFWVAFALMALALAPALLLARRPLNRRVR
jgi:EmrB/QacA subfamily drug resistance transporter